MNPISSDKAQQPIQTVTDVIAPAPAAALAATLDYGAAPRAGETLPPAWHWIYFWSAVRQTELGADGHPRTGGFLPDLGLPRRMAAGGRLTFSAPLVIGSTAERSSRVVSVKRKEGRNGRLAFVTVEHDINVDGVPAILEEQDIVYRERVGRGSSQPAPTRAPEGAQWQREIQPTEVLLFRYSALTLNGHRIHYDRSYAREVEGYPDLVVHGPLIATLLVDLVARQLPEQTIREYAFTAVRPTFVGHPFLVCAKPSPDGRLVELWAQDHEGLLTMTARAVLA